MKKITLAKSCLLFIVLTACCTVYSQKNLPQLGKSPVSEIVKAMSLEEKAQLLVGTNKRVPGEISEAAIRGRGAVGFTGTISRFGIPGIIMADGPAGVRLQPYFIDDKKISYTPTAWPVGISLASSWDVNLLNEVGIAFGNEVKEYGVDILLAPGMNIIRNPLNGRNFEYYSEDPVVSGYIASAFVKGVQSNGVGTSIKHFIANNQEANRDKVNANISERALREIYLRGFEIAVKNANPLTVMTSYNKVNGLYTSENPDLTTTILRNEWGFKNLVMTDWNGGSDVVAQMKARNNIIMPGKTSQIEQIIAAVNEGKLDLKIVDKNIEEILNLILQTSSFKKYNYSNNPDLVGHAAIARNAASESMVLLKNNSNKALPLNTGTKVALYGAASYETIIGGFGSGAVLPSYKISILDGLTNAGYRITGNLKESYAAYKAKTYAASAYDQIPEMEISQDVINQTANDADVAILTIGRKSGEGGDRQVNNDFNLFDVEKKLIKNLSGAFHAKGKKIVVIINAGSVIETASWRDYADAILLPWQPGMEAGNAIADVISGKVNPSGKLTVTFPMKYEDEPSSTNFPGTPIDKPTEVIYKEGIYVGYRYYNSFKAQTAYEFGYGLSYTNFNYSGLKLSTSKFKDKITATLTVTNSGKVSGKEVVQLYLTAPEKTLEKPSEELRAFAKTNLLKPGESQTISFQLNPRDLASYNTEQSSWIADGGTYTVKVGASSRDIKLTKEFKLAKDIEVEKNHKVLTPTITINELKRIKQL
ncbi:beta-glucosidase [Flavobacterium sufflavum]|uniref:Beta-glucosidase n=1 Tax=Flavobacterium sufflavum TaxID=1921138 RepID=A0A437L2V0_9FLAO|nr:glycoside hydrolase family 3 C-terminal domain-containing protein [Flavobacterium sufflavum]RVT79640.1 beta-glucosidase [Flavobacterium sufflavum]